MQRDVKRVERRRIAFARWAKVPVADVGVVVSPYRVCPIGAHVEHQHGPVRGMGIDMGTILTFVPSRDATVHLESAGFPGEDLACDAFEFCEDVGG